MSVNPSQIAFNIPTDGSDAGCVVGVCTIALNSGQGALPAIIQPVLINGYTQTGAMRNNQNLSVGDNATLTIVLSGFASPGLIGLDFYPGSTNSAVKGLVINTWPGSDITLSDGTSGIVKDVKPDKLTQPIVRIAFDATGADITPHEIDLSQSELTIV